MVNYPLYISSSQVESLKQLATTTTSGVSRICCHEDPSSLIQIMLIALTKSKRYDFIRDNIPGLLIFLCLEGSLEIETISEDHVSNTFQLSNGESLTVPRSYWRKTFALTDVSVYLECIEGAFDRQKRESMFDQT